MRLHHLRSATLVLEWSDYRVVVDPMLAACGIMLPFRWLARARRRNPIVPLPANCESLLENVTHALITHCRRGHVDHLDAAGIHLLRSRDIPVFCSAADAGWLSRKAASNLRKHGVSFEAASTVFSDRGYLLQPDAESSHRFLAIGMSGLLRILVVVNLERGPRVRIISARKAKRSEVRAHEDRRL